MKKLIPLLLSISISTLLLSQNFTIETIPNPKSYGNGYVSNPSNILSQSEIDNINFIISNIEDSTEAQIAVVMVNSIGEENPKEFATNLFNHWGIGQKYADNGLLILSVMDQRRTEFETGLGTEAVLPDLICYRVGMQELVPHFKEGNYGKGVSAALIRFKTILENPEVIAEFRHNRAVYGNDKDGFPIWWWYVMVNLLFHLGFLIWVMLTLWNKEELYDKYMSIRMIWGWWWMIPFPVPYVLTFFLLKNLLNRLRNQVRFSKVSGRKMQKLSEEEEDDFLEKGQISEEEIGAADYDVWVDEEGEDILILRYAQRFSKYSSCPECDFKTYFLAHTAIVSHATYASSGSRELIHECQNCHYQKIDYQKIPRKRRSSSGGGGFSGGGGSFGGGSSGGGGGGVSW